MAYKSLVEWTDSTWPIVQGCDYESPGCSHCYAVPLLWRLSHNPNALISGPLQGVVAKNSAGKLHFTGKVALREDRLDWPLKWKEPRQIFLPSHGDLFHPSVPDWFIDKTFGVMALCPHHTFQVLTKRGNRMRTYVLGAHERIARAAMELTPTGRTISKTSLIFEPSRRPSTYFENWPLPNVWLGVSTEDQTRADERIPELLATPAAKRFISAEPLLGEINILDAMWAGDGDPLASLDATIDWVIIGLESGPKARDGDIGLVRCLVRQCSESRTACFVKQLGAKPYVIPFPEDPGYRRWLKLADRKGGDWSEWPADLQVREFPA